MFCVAIQATGIAAAFFLAAHPSPLTIEAIPGAPAPTSRESLATGAAATGQQIYPCRTPKVRRAGSADAAATSPACAPPIAWAVAHVDAGGNQPFFATH